MLTYLIQLTTVGLLWVTIHCAGMCGPIVAGLNASTLDQTDDGDDTEPGLLARGALNIVAYQAGRSITYAAFGALAGLLGASLETAVLDVGRIAALVAGVAMILVGLASITNIQRFFPTSSPTTTSTTDSPDGSTGSVTGRIGRAARKLSDLIPASGRGRIVLFGAVMGFLPCMLMFWVLALAASTANPLGGAGLMVGLVILTTPVLLFAGTSPLLAAGRFQRWSSSVRAGAMMLSGVWLVLIGAAHNGWITHQKFIFEMFGRSFTLMLW